MWHYDEALTVLHVPPWKRVPQSMSGSGTKTVVQTALIDVRFEGNNGHELRPRTHIQHHEFFHRIFPCSAGDQPTDLTAFRPGDFVS
jgi:hypothetical protein